MRNARRLHIAIVVEMLRAVVASGDVDARLLDLVEVLVDEVTFRVGETGGVGVVEVFGIVVALGVVFACG
jgi:hypothetical protein